MSRAPVHIALGLLDAGWQVAGVTFDGVTGGEPTVSVTLTAPPIALNSDDPDLQRLIARAMGGASKEP